MIPIIYNRDENILNKFCEKVKENRNKKDIAEVDKKCKIYLEKTLDEVICCSPEELLKLGKIISSKGNYNEIKQEFKNINPRKKQDKARNYIVNILYGDMPKEAKRLIYQNVGVKVCPYCNRNFVEELSIKENDDNFVGTFELDHFYSKEQFPMFAVAFYNLIPVCSICNRIKHNKNFNINPYLRKDANDIKFKYDVLGVDYLTDETQLEIKLCCSNKEASEDAETLRLRELYNGHKDIVQEIIKKTKYYNQEYIKGVSDVMGMHFKDKDEIYRYIYGGYANPDQFGKRPLSKFIKDVYQDTVETIGGYDVFKDESL